MANVISSFQVKNLTLVRGGHGATCRGTAVVLRVQAVSWAPAANTRLLL